MQALIYIQVHTNIHIYLQTKAMQWVTLNCIYNCINKSEWNMKNTKLQYILKTIKENETILIELLKISN